MRQRGKVGTVCRRQGGSAPLPCLSGVDGCLRACVPTGWHNPPQSTCQVPRHKAARFLTISNTLTLRTKCTRRSEGQRDFNQKIHFKRKKTTPQPQNLPSENTRLKGSQLDKVIKRYWQAQMLPGKRPHRVGSLTAPFQLSKKLK